MQKKGRTEVQSWKVLETTNKWSSKGNKAFHTRANCGTDHAVRQFKFNMERGEMTVPLLRKTQVMVSFGEIQSCNENAYIIPAPDLA